MFGMAFYTILFGRDATPFFDIFITQMSGFDGGIENGFSL